MITHQRLNSIKLRRIKNSFRLKQPRSNECGITEELHSPIYFIPFATAGKVNLAGSYGCEVSSEGPSFLTIYGEANMSVAIPPKERPGIRGLRPSYEAGETLQAECSSAASYPPAHLVFILNGKEVREEKESYENVRLLEPRRDISVALREL